MLLAAAVPVTVNVLSLVIWSVVLIPVSTVTEATKGVAGAVVSMVHGVTVAAPLWLPAASLAVTLKLGYVPSGKTLAVTA